MVKHKILFHLFRPLIRCLTRGKRVTFCDGCSAAAVGHWADTQMIDQEYMPRSLFTDKRCW